MFGRPSNTPLGSADDGKRATRWTSPKELLMRVGSSRGGHKRIAPDRWQTDFESTGSARDILQFSENKLFQSANRSRHPSLFRQNHGNRSRHPSKIFLGSDCRLRQKFVFRSIHSEIGSKKVRPLSHLRNKVLKN